MKRSILSIFLLIFLFSSVSSYADVITFSPIDGGGMPVNSGIWNESDNWSPIGVPSPSDIIIIPIGKTLNVDLQVKWGNKAVSTIIVYGELHFNSGQKITLSCGSNVIVYEGSVTKANGGGNSNYINICNSVVWNAARGNFNDTIINFANIPSPITLPIELTTFKAYSKSSNVEVFWTTASESNNDFFSVERSLNGIDFEVIGEVIGAGNSNTTLNYSFTDEDPLKEVAYYRLKQTDFNLDYSYSKLVAVKNEVSKEVIFKVYPNPVNQSESINLYISGENSGDIKISVYNAFGRMVFNQTLNNAANTEVSLDFHNSIPKGTYFITLVSNNKVYKQKLIINE